MVKNAKFGIIDGKNGVRELSRGRIKVMDHVE
jgi:hypothetical protein